MLSIIICSINQNQLRDIEKNISDTIGINYELIKYDNSVNKFGICKVYNLCAIKARYEYLLFLHDDVIFHTNNWGSGLIQDLQIQNVGIVGISGAVYKSPIPSAWSMIPTEYYRINAIQRWKNGSVTEEIKKESPEKDFSEVVVLDGVFMAMRKEVWTQFHFDEINLQGFHFYDLDMSIRVGSKYQLMVTHQLLLEHFSEGNTDKEWIKGALVYHKVNMIRILNSNKFINQKERKKIDSFVCNSFTYLCIKESMYITGVKYFLIGLKLNFTSREHIKMIKYFLLSIFRK